MYRHILYTLIVGLLLSACGNDIQTAQKTDTQTPKTAGPGNDCEEWWLVGRGTNLVPAYPDTHTDYWLWNFSRDDHSRPTAFQITGQFPYARYTSFQSYGRTATKALVDADIVPDSGSVNPFRPGANRQAPKRSYTLWFVPPESPRAGKPNTLVMPPDMPAPNLVMRIVMPDEGRARGGIPLPKIHAFDDVTGDPVACPGKTLRSFYNPFSGITALAPVEDRLSFYRYTGEGFVPNLSNAYLGARLAFPFQGNLAALRFKVPTFPHTYNNSAAVITGEEQVRYMGICVHGLISTLTSQCLADGELKKDSQSFAHVIVGPADAAVQKAARARGYDYLSWEYFMAPILLYRQIMPREDFAGSANRVPVYDDNLAVDRQRAENFIGEYAPRGQLCSVSEFMQGSNCGLPEIAKTPTDTAPSASPDDRDSLSMRSLLNRVLAFLRGLSPF
jgi:hypothetical protein